MFFSKQKKRKIEAKKNLVQNPKILEVNLIKDEVKIAFDWNKNISLLLLVLFITGLFIGEIYYGLDWWEKQENIKSQAISDEINKVNADIKQIKDESDEAFVYKDKSIELGRLLNNHIYWSNFFSWLEKRTLSTVSFNDFSGKADGIYSLNAKAQSYAEVSWQVKNLADSSIVKKVDVFDVALISGKDKDKNTERGVNFVLELEVDPVIFKK